jgi:hypothetical protein
MKGRLVLTQDTNRSKFLGLHSNTCRSAKVISPKCLFVNKLVRVNVEVNIFLLVFVTTMHESHIHNIGDQSQYLCH